MEAIERGANKREVCGQRLDQIIDEQFADGVGSGTDRLGLLLEMDCLEIKIAVPTTGTGIYHEKIGIFLNGDDYVAFTGSSNESRSAFESNRECIDVYTSWHSPVRAERKRKHFEELWQGTDKGVDVFRIPDAVKNKLIRVCEEQRNIGGAKERLSRKWRHQDDSVEIFLAAERGVLNMATGTGKTRTALKILTALFRSREIDTTIVTTDGNDLLDQWYGELLAIRKDVECPLRIFRHYSNLKELQRFVLDTKNSILLVSRPAVDSALRELDRTQAQRSLLVHDEVHRLGSPGNRRRLSGLSDAIRFRLGLSATPEREYDLEGSAFIESHIGPVLVTFGLEEAIERGILTPFNYYPLSFVPTDDDRERIAAVYRKRAARERSGNPMSEVELWIEIARVYKTSLAKLPIFSEFIKNHDRLLERCIVFTETMEYGSQVLDIVHEYRSDFHTYFSGEDSQTLRKFARGDLECLVTCHRLSEGIDIKSLNTVILFSSERARLETVQRIGRCLRTNPEFPGKTSNIVDFIREGRDGDDSNSDEERREWLTALSRVRSQES